MIFCGSQGCCKAGVVIEKGTYFARDRRPLTAGIYTELIFYGGLPSVVCGRVGL